MTIDYFTPAAADAPALAAMAEQCFTETFGHLYAPHNLAAFIAQAYGPTGLQAEVSDPAITIRAARENGAIAGYAKIGPVSLPANDPAPDAIELRQLYVLQPWQGSGLARSLMEWTIETARARGASELYLSVYIDNLRARRFYERYGFTDIGPYAFMVGDHADEDRLLKLAL